VRALVLPPAPDPALHALIHPLEDGFVIPDTRLFEAGVLAKPHLWPGKPRLETFFRICGLYGLVRTDSSYRHGMRRAAFAPPGGLDLRQADAWAALVRTPSSSTGAARAPKRGRAGGEQAAQHKQNRKARVSAEAITCVECAADRAFCCNVPPSPPSFRLSLQAHCR